MEIQDPRSYIGFPGGYVAPRSCFFAPRNRTEAPGGKIASRADKPISRNETSFMKVIMECSDERVVTLRVQKPHSSYVQLV